MTEGDDILDSPFHFAALRAYMETAVASKQFPPDSQATRIRAYQLYEEALAEKNRQQQPDIRRTPAREAGPGCTAPQGGGQLQPRKLSQNRLADARKAAK